METTKATPEKGKKVNVLTIVTMGLLTAIVVVLQLFASNIKLGPFSVTFCLAPIVVGAALFGWKAGLWLGFTFGLVVMFTDTALFMAINPAGTIVTVMLKGMLAGLAAGLIYKPVAAKKGDMFATIICGIVVPLVNKLVFIAGCAAFFLPTVQEWAGSSNVVFYLFIGWSGWNFPVELAVNLTLGVALVRVIQLGRKQLIKQQ